MAEEEEEPGPPEDLFWNGSIIKRVVQRGRAEPRPVWGDETVLNYIVREHGEKTILRLRRDWLYVIGADIDGFLPRRHAEAVLVSMAPGERAVVVVQTELFENSLESFQDAPWLRPVGGFERADVEAIEYIDSMKLNLSR
eukprot:gnl/MRDRNA2_/MRDRNA2_57460_c0_seq2.p1 gnl/MRDRNA2_/MRDRNA2_57460_c0~~gnl/MRDRNA2_/MRDRNA2_57460_c0_seq2.p1  ORF type:complete len:154 (-),score=34.52 gnl/MRDRNA2_/MRDRNA2_57460_c0_seq2:256-675(-)